MDINRLDRVLKRYIEGKSSAEEIRMIEDWLNSDWKKSEQWDNMDGASRNKLLADLYDEVQQTIHSRRKVVSLNHSSRWRMIGSIAATVLLVCGLYFTWPSLIDMIAPAAYKQVSVSAGKMKKLVLADGTQLWLNSGSRLTYPERFNRKSREVYLDGEAYFEVSHQASRPFIVHTGQLETKVLGTVFNITAYGNRKDVKVVLLSGKVEVRKTETESESGLILLPKQAATYQKNGGSLVKTDERYTGQYSGWKEGKLIFNDTPMTEVLERLSISYNMKFEVENEKLKNCKITGTFSTHQKPEEIIKSIAISIGGKYLKVSDRIIIQGEGCVR